MVVISEEIIEVQFVANSVILNGGGGVLNLLLSHNLQQFLDMNTIFWNNVTIWIDYHNAIPVTRIFNSASFVQIIS